MANSLNSNPAEEVPEDVVAAITAAIVNIYGVNFKIRKVRFLNPELNPSWVFAGRMGLMASRNLSLKR